MGRRFIQNCENFGLIETKNEVNREALSAVCTEKERRSRAQAFDSLLIYSLEALTDPRRLEEAKRRFMDLFDKKTPKPSESSKNCGGSCIGC